MKLRVFLFTAIAALVAVSVAVAAPPPGKGKPATTPPTGAGKPSTTGCQHPRVTVVLKGTFTSLSSNMLTMAVTRGNHWARAWVALKTATVTIDPSTTKVRIDQRNGVKTLADLADGDWLLVQARACTADLQSTTLPTLTAVRIVAHQAKA